MSELSLASLTDDERNEALRRAEIKRNAFWDRVLLVVCIVVAVIIVSGVWL